MEKLDCQSRIALDTYRTYLELIPATLTVAVSRGVSVELSTLELADHPQGSQERWDLLLSRLKDLSESDQVHSITGLDPLCDECFDD